ncbi:MAG TPA: hypothetical protein PKX25_02205, partial [Microthrixaceae bacterium]|nr:hypothetical protein [Microthrixaceae bacterium]
MHDAGPILIRDVEDPRLADYRHLNDAAARVAAGRDDTTGGGCAIVEGAVALEVVLRAGIPLRSLLLTRTRAESMAPLLERRAADVPLFVA